MFPFSGHKQLPVEQDGSLQDSGGDSFGYELVQFDRENVNVFTARVRCCEPHWHDAPEFIYVLSGAFTTTVNRTVTALTAGGMIYINGGEVHSLEAAAPDSRLLTIQFSPDLFRHSNQDLILTYAVRGPLEYGEKEAGLIAAFRELIGHSVKPDAPASFTKISLIYRLLAELQNAGVIVSDTDVVHIRRKDESLIKKAIEYINEHYGDELDMSAMAGKFHCSYYHFSKLFKKISGYNFKEYLNYVRINKARFLLKNTRIPITDISFLCGFKEHKYLIAVFRKHYAMTPTEFRKGYTLALHPGYNAMITDFEHLPLSPDVLETITMPGKTDQEFPLTEQGLPT